MPAADFLFKSSQFCSPGEADLQLRGERGEEEPQLRRLAEALQPGEGLVEHLGRGPAF